MSGSEVFPGLELVEKSYPDLARSPSQGVYVVVRGSAEGTRLSLCSLGGSRDYRCGSASNHMPTSE